MKIIYDSENNFENSENESFGSIQSQDVEISFDGKEKPTVHRPKPTLTPPPKVQSAPKVQGEVQPQVQPQAQPFNAVDANGNPVYTAPVAMTPEQWGMMMAQFAAMQQAGMIPQAPVQNQGVPTQNPYAQSPYQGFVPYEPAEPIFDGNGYNPGTKVLYQSEDFDSAEKTPKRTAPVYEPTYKTEPVYESQLEIEEETVEVTRNSNRFSVDEDEMTMFEFDAMAKKMKVPEYRKTGSTNLHVEEEEEEFLSEDEGKEEEKKEKISTTELIRRIVLAVSLVAIVISSGMLINEYRLSKQNDNVMDEVSELIIDEGKKKPNKQNKEEKELTPEEQWAKIKKENPNVVFPENMQLKYAKLYATNKEFVGYLSAEGVGINLPIVQAKDDKKYLEKNFYLQNTKYGCPFVTHLNNIEPLDQNTVIFGHHMNNGTIFGALDNYKSIEGFKKAPVITFNTLYKDYSWKVIAAFVTNAYTKDDNGYIFRYYFTQLSTEENFAAYLSELSQRSLYDTGVDVLPTDKLLTLSTCSHEFTDARFVVVARLVRPGESTDVDVSRATVNSNPRYPQAWYNKKGKNNPYKNAFQWEVS